MSKSTIIKTTLSIIILCLWCDSAIAQNRDELTLLLQKYAPKQTESPLFSKAVNTKNELQTAFSGFFLLYKNFISSQDFPGKCTFHPSCSVYGMEAVRAFGPMKGMVVTFDRLIRCNGLNPDKYKFDSEKKVFLDPIE